MGISCRPNEPTILSLRARSTLDESVMCPGCSVTRNGIAQACITHVLRNYESKQRKVQNLKPILKPDVSKCPLKVQCLQ